MIPRRYIEEWAEFVNWNENNQVEQDLIITRALIVNFRKDILGLLQPGINFDLEVAYHMVRTEILEKL